MEFFNAFGISWDIVLAQLVNFAILLFILHRFAYKQIIQFVKDRTANIEKGLADAKEAAQRLESAQAEQEQILQEARKEALIIIETSKQSAKTQADELLQKARKDVANIVKQGKQTIEAERKTMLDEVKKDVITMVLESTKKVLEKSIDEKVDEAWLKQQLSKQK